MKRTALLLILLLVLCMATAAGGDDIKYALSMFHFNIQYVAGGLEGFFPFWDPIPSWEINAAETEDMIVTESFEPIVDLFLEHPDWTVTLEMQGYFLDVLADRHPDVLNKLRTLAKAGGAEMVSFHYSDQLFIAYPYEDWRRSVELTIATFEKHDIPLSGTVFCQEGQASPGMAAAMEQYGYDVMVWPKNLWIYQHGDFDAAPYYTFGNINLIAGAKGVNDPVNGVYVNWTFFGDGELLATGDMDPYFPWFFKHRPAEVQAYEDNLQSLSDQGYVIGAVGDYVQALKDAAVPVASPPELMGGTWQPGSTDGTHRWMGGQGLIWFKQERDNFVRTTGALAHRELLAAETVADQAGIDARDTLDQAWRLLALGQVTDATGINPFRGEIEYGIAHMNEAMRIAREVIDQSKQALGYDDVIIDTAANTATEGTEPDDTQQPTIDAPVGIEVTGKARQIDQQWYGLSEDPLIAKLILTFSAKEADAFWTLETRFAGQAGPIEFSAGLAEDQVLSFDRSQFVFEHFYLPLPNGLIGLGNDLFAIKDMAYVHLAAQVFTASPDVVFRDETATWYETQRHVYYVVEGKQAALDFANTLNVTPTLFR